MITKDKIKKGEFPLKVLVVGGSGSGKTHFGATFPSCYFASTEPGGMDTILSNSNLFKNLEGYDVFIPQSPKDTKESFLKLNQALVEVREHIKEGKIKTIVLDNITYLSENRWSYIETYESQLTRTGEKDTRAQYGFLARWMYQFVLFKLLSMPCNVVVTAHEMLESDEALDKKPDKTTPVLANILGGFRDKCDGMFSIVLYLTKLKGQDKRYHYFCRTNKGNQRNAKSRINLPEIIEDISYSKIREIISSSMKGGKKEGASKPTQGG